MEIWISLLLFAAGVVLVVKGGDIFVDAAGWIARASGIPTFIIGATIVSVATTLPEMIVSMLAAGEEKVDMAIGNAIGSVTANTGLILAIAMIFMSIVIERKDYIFQCILLIAAAALLPLSSINGELAVWGSLILLAIFIAFIVINIRKAKSEMDENQDKPKIRKKNIAINIVKFVIGAAAIVGGSQLLVNSGSDIAEYFKVPERIIAVTMVAIGTSLPELVTTITAIVKKQSSLSVGNLIGANIIDLTLILPLCSVVSGKALPIPETSMTVDMPACLIILAIAFIPLLIRQKAAKLQGALLLVMYCSYIVVAVL